MSQTSGANRAPVTSAKESLREVERRRSERLMITVPIRVEGLDRDGVKFSEETRTIVINREGARIYLKRKMFAGTHLLISTMGGRRTGKFRVVGPTRPPSGEGGEWGVECLELNKDLWGIGFPPPSSEEGTCAALLECRRCHAVKLNRLSLIEHEVLGTSGLLVYECEVCKCPTSWSFKEPSLAYASNEPGTTLPSPETIAEAQKASNRRINNRVALQLPIRVRSFYGGEEFTRTENVSRGGLCFITERNYEVGEVILLTCPFEKSGNNIEVRGQVVNRRQVQGSGRKVYGVCYER